MDHRDEYLVLINTWDSLGLWFFLRDQTQENQADLYNSFENGKKVKYKRVHDSLEKAGYMIATSLAEDMDLMAETEDIFGLKPILEEPGVLHILELTLPETYRYIKEEIWTTEF